MFKFYEYLGYPHDLGNLHMDPFIPLAPRHSLCVPSDQREVGLHHPLSFSPFFGDSNHQSIWEVNMTLRHMKHYCI